MEERRETFPFFYIFFVINCYKIQVKTFECHDIPTSIEHINYTYLFLGLVNLM